MKIYKKQIFKTNETIRNVIFGTITLMSFFSFVIANNPKIQNQIVVDFKQAEPIVTVKGKVTDEDGIPLQGVIVLLIERARIVKTDAKGEFVIAAPVKENLEFSISGFESRVLKASNKMLNVRLKKV